MKKFIVIILGILTAFILGSSLVYGQNPFYFVSTQLAPDPDDGECLTTDGVNNEWSSDCGSGGSGSGLATTSIDTESELEAVLTDVTNLFTNNDGALNDDDLSDNDTDDLAEGSNLYYTNERSEDATGGMVTGNTETLISVTYQDGDGTLDFVVDNDLSNYDSSSLTITESQISDLGSYLTTVDISDDTNLTGDSEIVLTDDTLSIASTLARDSELHSAITLTGTPDYITLSGQQITRGLIDLANDVTGNLAYSNMTLTNSILEADLKVVDTATDEECLTYESTTGDFEWQTCGGSPAGSSGYVQFNDSSSFGGDDDFFWDNTEKRLGIGTTTPASQLHVSSSTSATSTLQLGTDGKPGCIVMRDSDDAGWSYATVLDGTISWSTTSCE